VCRGDEDLAQMRSFIQHRVTLGTDDSDAARWLYGDGGRSCIGLMVTKAGAGSGTVTSTPGGITCGGTCSATFGPGDVVALAAVPDAKSVFSGWSGDLDCADGSVTMDASKSCTATFALRPDLVVASLSVPDAAVPGTAISVTEKTKNNAGPADVSTTHYYLSKNGTRDASDPELGTRLVPALGHGETSAATLSLTVPAGTPTGNYYVIARADGGGQLAESNESNNTRAASIRISPPDLIVSALSVPSSGGAGRTIRVTNTTRNQSGAGPAPASITSFYLSLDAILDGSDIEIGSRAVGTLQGGRSSSVVSNVTIPAGTAPGSWSIIAKADADGAISEVSETNNTRSDTIVIGPDLVVSGLSVSSTGRLITVTDTVKNQGAGSILIATTVDFYLSTKSTLGGGEVLLGSRTVGVLGPSATSRGITTLTVPADTVAGRYYVIAKADAGAAVAEISESNNTRADSITLSP
jgi:subtilase family serine protease